MIVKPLFLKPAPDRRVRHPDGPLLDDAGEAVSPSPYWTRKLDDGDVVEGTPLKTPKAPMGGAD